ncbi:MFS transporter [Streptomyces sp. NTH33]|uniref:MFS transporter n=1 Tax=Streptomyces sp. NTH33 TaxID=1735453 RepID=UPI000DA9E161|nr:MFS transporter [Streptomyces sp. NTH33]PZH04840.1 MFS transporter [Streptomyces sp. NTH33]
MKGPAPAQALLGRGIQALGGPARARIVLTLAATLAVDGADKGTVSAMASQLKHTFGINNTQIGLLVSVVALSSAVFTVPVGLLTDRTRRTRLLAISVTLWAAATLLAGASTSYMWLLFSRAALGAVSATAGPTIASLMGDYFPVKDRARMYGFVLAGEMVGTGLGFAFSGSIGSFLTWRFAFWWLVIPAGALVWFLHRLPEPARGGQPRLERNQEHLPDERDVSDADTRHQAPQRAQSSDSDRQDADLAVRAAQRAQVEPHEHLVLDSDPRKASKWWSIRYVLRVRTNLVLIGASAFGYFYFTGLRSFATLYTTRHYGIATSVATSLVLVVGIGALAGVLSGGRIADRLLRGGRVNARALVPTVCMLTVPLFLAPAIYVSSLAVALPLLVAGTSLLGAANPPLDAARLDILPPFLWGTGEGVRTMLRTLCEAAAPTLFGYFSTTVFTDHGSDSSTGLEYTLLFFLLALVAAGLLGLAAMRSYPRDVATAQASTQRIEESLHEHREREN